MLNAHCIMIAAKWTSTILRSLAQWSESMRRSAIAIATTAALMITTKVIALALVVGSAIGDLFTCVRRSRMETIIIICMVSLEQSSLGHSNSLVAILMRLPNTWPLVTDTLFNITTWTRDSLSTMEQQLTNSSSKTKLTLLLNEYTNRYINLPSHLLLNLPYLNLFWLECFPLN